MNTLTPEQQAKIKAMSAAAKRRWRSTGPRSFPKYSGQSTSVYVMQYRLENLHACAWRSNEVNCAIHSNNPIHH